MVLANRYDWQLFLEVTGPGGSGKSILAEIATMLAGEDNATSATIETLESPRERAALIGFSLIRLPDQEKWSGDGAGLKAITGGDAVSVDPKYQNAYSTHIPAVILAVNNNPMRFTDRSGGVSRRRVILHFPEQIAPEERDPQLKDKIARELAVIVRQLMQRFSDPMSARTLLQSQQNSMRLSPSSVMLIQHLIFVAILRHYLTPTVCLWGTPILSHASHVHTFTMPTSYTWRLMAIKTP